MDAEELRLDCLMVSNRLNYYELTVSDSAIRLRILKSFADCLFSFKGMRTIR